MLIEGNDLISREAYYHKSCWTTFYNDIRVKVDRANPTKKIKFPQESLGENTGGSKKEFIHE